jgi:hypothetical protein
MRWLVGWLSVLFWGVNMFGDYFWNDEEPPRRAIPIGWPQSQPPADSAEPRTDLIVDGAAVGFTYAIFLIVNGLLLLFFFR